MEPFETIIFEKKQGIAQVTLNRPKVLNSYNIKMRDELHQALGVINDDPEVKAAVFTGAGDKAFCAGADLTEFGTAPSQAIARQVRFERDIWGLFLSIPKPLIAAVHGYCLGSGVEIAFCCDIRIVTPEAKFGLPEVSLGMIPAALGTQTFPRYSGRSKSLEIMLTARTMDAQEAYNTGLAAKIVPRERLMIEAESLAAKLMDFDQNTLRLAKEAVVRGTDLSLAEGLAMEKRLACMVVSAAD